MNREEALKKRQGRRLAAAREEAGYDSGRSAALENGWPESSYRAHEAGRRTIGQDDAERYATRFRARGARVTARSILFDDPGREPREKTDEVRVPLVSWVSAGQLTDASSQIPLEDVPLLTFADLGRGDFFALRVQGDSMDAVSPEGSIIVVNRSDRNLINGKLYVFSVRGETTFKAWQKGEPPYLAPLSRNPLNRPVFFKKRDLQVIGRVCRTVLDL